MYVAGEQKLRYWFPGNHPIASNRASKSIHPVYAAIALLSISFCSLEEWPNTRVHKCIYAPSIHTRQKPRHGVGPELWAGLQAPVRPGVPAPPPGRWNAVYIAGNREIIPLQGKKNFSYRALYNQCTNSQFQFLTNFHKKRARIKIQPRIKIQYPMKNRGKNTT